MTSMTEAEFDSQFTHIIGADNSTVLEFEEVIAQDNHHVWTWVDGDNGEACLIPGVHFVNRFGYALTEEPWIDESLCVVMDSPEPEIQS